MGTAETGIFLNLLKFLYKFIPAKAVIKIEVRKLSYVLTGNDPYSPISVVTPIPSRYYVKARASHLRGIKTTISETLLKIDGKLNLTPFNFKPFKIDVGEMNETTISFPVEEKEAVKEGKFEIQFIDIHNNKHSSKGNFPIK